MIEMQKEIIQLQEGITVATFHKDFREGEHFTITSGSGCGIGFVATGYESSEKS